MKEFMEAYRYCKENKSWNIKVFAITTLAMGADAYVGVFASELREE